MTAARIDSKAVDAELRRVFWPTLKAVGFDRTHRTAWRHRPEAIQIVNVQSFNSYLADVIGATTYSFGVNLAVFYPVIARATAVGSFIKDLDHPPEYHGHARRKLLKGISQPGRSRWFGRRRTSASGRPWADRPDVWYVEADGRNVHEVVADAADQLTAVARPWLDRLSDLAEARRTFLEDEGTPDRRGYVAEMYGGGLGSPNRWIAVGFLSVALGDAEGADWAAREMAALPYFTHRPGDLAALRAAARSLAGAPA